MSYTGIGFVNDNPPAINAANLNKMDNELVYLDGQATLLNGNVGTADSNIGYYGRMQRTFAMTAGNGHSNSKDRFKMQINQGEKYNVNVNIPVSGSPAIAIYEIGADGTGTLAKQTASHSFSVIASKDIAEIGVYIGSLTLDANVTVTIEKELSVNAEIEDLQEIDGNYHDVLYRYTPKNIQATSSGTRLTSDGIFESVSGYTCDIYAFGASSKFYIKAKDKYQIQTSYTFPTVVGSRSRIGATYSDFEGEITNESGSTQYIVISRETSDTESGVFFYDSKIQEMLDAISDAGFLQVVDFTNSTEGSFIAYNGTVSQSANFLISPDITMKQGDTIRFKGVGYNQNVAMISIKSGSTYSPVRVSIDSGYREYDYVALSDCTVVLSCNKIQPHYATVNHIPQEGNRVTISDMFGHGVLFPKLAVIGDSLASGELVINGNATDVWGDSWLSYIARKTNAISRYHYSQGGEMTKTWLTHYSEVLQSDPVHNAYFIALGTNDNYRQEYPVGNISDAAGTNSFVGYYKQIIELVRTKAPNCVIFCVSLYNSGESHHTMSELISDIADLYDNCFYVDFINRTKIWISTGSPWVETSHFTTIGYNYVAGIIYELVCEIVDNNPTFFKFFGKENSTGGKYE